MKLHRRNQEEIDVNLTPMIDVVFLLLIFFMITTTFKKTSDIDITLPKASAQPSKKTQDPLEITVFADGSYSVNGEQVANQELTTLVDAIRQMASGDSKQPVQLRADGQATHQAVVKAMDALRQLGLTQLAIITENRN